MIATANDISQLPPELLRKGRVDEIIQGTCQTRASAAKCFAFTWPSAAETQTPLTSNNWRKAVSEDGFMAS